MSSYGEKWHRFTISAYIDRKTTEKSICDFGSSLKTWTWTWTELINVDWRSSHIGPWLYLILYLVIALWSSWFNLLTSNLSSVNITFEWHLWIDWYIIYSRKYNRYPLSLLTVEYVGTKRRHIKSLSLKINYWVHTLHTYDFFLVGLLVYRRSSVSDGLRPTLWPLVKLKIKIIIENFRSHQWIHQLITKC